MSQRQRHLDRIDGGSFDVLIVGGGINGAVSSAVLAGRGARVALVDRGDFGGATSQESSNLVWGGFKYLENYELLLVRKLCMSRNRLIKAYPDNIKTIGFYAALDESGPYAPWFAALGATAYWGIGNFTTPRPRYLSKETIEREEPVVNTTGVKGGIEYFDAYLKDNDSRFVFSFVRQAMDVGAAAANYVELRSATKVDGRWVATLVDRDDPQQREFTCTADVIVNAAGPFIDGLNNELATSTDHRIVYSKGIHLVVPRINESERVLAFYDDTERLFYVIPMGRRSVIGTTDTRTDNAHEPVTSEDRQFLLEQINARVDLDRPLTEADIIAERNGVRPLVVKAGGSDQDDVDWTKLSRKHEIEVDDRTKVVSIFGGKLTDCLNVGEEVAEAVEHLGLALEADTETWYGEPSRESRDAFFRRARLMRLDDLRSRPDVEPLSERLWRRYGRRAFDLLDHIEADPSMGQDVMANADYLRVELHLAAETEMVTELDDFLRRRSKIDLVVPDSDIRSADGLADVARILFGDRADEKLATYLATPAIS